LSVLSSRDNNSVSTYPAEDCNEVDDETPGWDVFPLTSKGLFTDAVIPTPQPGGFGWRRDSRAEGTTGYDEGNNLTPSLMVLGIELSLHASLLHHRVL